MPFPIEDVFLSMLMTRVFPAIRRVMDESLQGFPEAEREAIKAKIEANILQIIENKLVPGFVRDTKAALAELLAQGRGPTGPIPPATHVV